MLSKMLQDKLSKIRANYSYYAIVFYLYFCIIYII